MKPKHPYIEFTLLDPVAESGKYIELVKLAKEHSDVVRSVCIPPVPHIAALCKKELAESTVGICTVIDFPFGDGGFDKKKDEILSMIWMGIFEFDVVINLPALRNGDLKIAQREINTLRMMTEKIHIKAILETGHSWYNEVFIKTVSKAFYDASVFCLKTSTGRQNHMTSAGFLPHIDFSDKVRHAEWMHEACPNLMIKVAGGIHDLQQVRDICVKIPADKVLIGTSRQIWLNGMPD